MRTRRGVLGAGLAAALLATPMLVGAGEAAPSGTYEQRNLVSDIPGVARITDPNLKNPWGLAARPDSPMWVANNGTDTATLYSGGMGDGPVQIVPLVVQVPGHPTGQITGTGNEDDFVVNSGSASGASMFLFSGLNGSVSGWNQAVPPPPPSMQVEAPVSGTGAVYTGLARALVPDHGDTIYAADFKNNRIDTFDFKFKPVTLEGSFTDPGLPAGFAPFNVQHLDNSIYVAYAKQDPATGEEMKGAGLGYVDVYDLHGRMVKRLASQGVLNAPWGMALAPDSFGANGGDLLVGNFGDGHISAYDPMTGESHGQLMNPDGNPIAIDGLWGIRFGSAGFAGFDTLVFAAGIGDEEHGLLGTIRPSAG